MQPTSPGWLKQSGEIGMPSQTRWQVLSSQTTKPLPLAAVAVHLWRSCLICAQSPPTALSKLPKWPACHCRQRDQTIPFAPNPDETAQLFLSLQADSDQEPLEAPEPEDDAESEASDDSRDETELEGIAWELRDLENKFEGLVDTYPLVDRLGEGTFSSVYKAVDVRHHQHDNAQWCLTCELAQQQLPTPDPTSSSSSNIGSGHKRKRDHDDNDLTKVPSSHRAGKPVHVAIKRIYVTSSPQRIANELQILADVRGCKYISNLITAFRHEDQVLAVMPYTKHADFRTFYRTMDLNQIRCYLRCLFSGLAYAHDLNIKHRDVKPGNFLFNPETNHGTLCDFGLAEYFEYGDWQSHCLHSLPCPQLKLPHGKRLQEPKAIMPQIEEYHTTFKALTEDQRRALGYTAPWVPVEESEERALKSKDKQSREVRRAWEPVDLSKTRSISRKSSKVGYLKPENDKRPSLRANRAGTRGFRAPEVLLKCPDQTVSIDVWSVGIIILCILTRRFPFFNCADDTEALMEIATIFGKEKMQSCAALHNRTFATNVPSVSDPEYDTLHQLVLRLNPKIFAENCPPEFEGEEDYSWYRTGHPLFEAVDLMRRTLALDCTKRISASDALSHPFLQRAR